MTIFICVVMCYCVWLVRSTIKRLDISVGRTGGEKEGPEGKGHLRSSNLKGHTQVCQYHFFLVFTYYTYS